MNPETEKTLIDTIDMMCKSVDYLIPNADIGNEGKYRWRAM